MVIAITVCCLAVQTATIRMMFAMARDNNLPAGSTLARVHPKTRTPIIPSILVGVLAIAILLVNIRQPQIFTVITSIGIIMIYIAYLLVTGPMLLARLRGQWKSTDAQAGYFSLGRWGLPVNILAVVWGLFMAINLIWPRQSIYNAVEPFHWYLKWGGVLFVGIVMLGGFAYYWFVQRHKTGTLAEHMAGAPRGARAGDGGRVRVTERSTPWRSSTTSSPEAGRRARWWPRGSPRTRTSRSACWRPGRRTSTTQPILRLEDWMFLLDSGYDWDYPVEPQEKGNSFLRHARAKVLGGCSSHNSCIAFWTPKEDLDEWAAMGCEGWGHEDTWPLIKRLETNDGPGDHHGRSGPVNLMTIPPDDPCGVAVLEAAAQAGLPTVRFNEGQTVTNGAGWFQVNRSKDGTRMSSSLAYLHPIMADRPNLKVRTGCWVKRIVIDEDRRARGVEYMNPDLFTYSTVGARREVIVSCGSIDTPKALMLSGIGPGEHLREFGVDVVVDSPGVGSNLDDHVEGIVMWEAAQPMVKRSTQWWEIGLFTMTEDGLDRPDLMMHYGSVPFDMNTVRWGYPSAESAFCLTPNVCRGRSRGTVRLRSPDFRDRMRVDPRYFTDPDGNDERVMLYGVKLAREIGKQAALQGWAKRELAPGPDATTDDELVDYIHKTHNTVYHPSCTARMGAEGDADAVVDPRLRVKGVKGLRIADGSIMPFLPAINPCITTMMIGEKCADMVKEDARQAPREAVHA